MKKTNILLVFGVAAIFLSSCASVGTSIKDIKYMPIRFKPLTRNDFTLVGELECTSVISGKGSSKGKVLDKEFSSNYKKGLITKSESTEIIYFAPAEGQSITGSLYENEIFNTVFGPTGQPKGIFKGLASRLGQLKSAAFSADPAMDFAYYKMVEKYPDVDYFINVRFDRSIVTKGKKFTETVIVKADGIKLKTDN